MTDELKALREEIAALRREVAELRAGGVHHHYHGPPTLLPQQPNPYHPPYAVPYWCGPNTASSNGRDLYPGASLISQARQ